MFEKVRKLILGRTPTVLPVIVLFLALRIVYLTSLPIFNDEAIYLHWGRVLLRRFPNPNGLPLAIDGKHAALPFLYGLIQQLPFDPLLLGRLTSLLASVVTLAACIVLARILQPGQSHHRFGFLLAACPFLIFFDRMAMPDSIIAACYTVTVVLLLYFLQSPTILTAGSIGLVIAAGWWFKSTILIALPVIGVVTLMRMVRQPRIMPSMVLRLLLMTVTVFLLISPLLLHASYRDSTQRDTYRIKQFQEMLRTPPSFYVLQAATIAQWLIVLLNPLLCIACLFGFRILRTVRYGNVVVLAILLPLLLEIILLRTLSARYILFIIPLLVYVGYRGMERFGRWRQGYFILTLSISVISSIILIGSPLTWYRRLMVFPAATTDFAQYVIGWPSGYGVKEAVEWILSRNIRDRIVVLVRKDSGNPEDGVFVYAARDPRVIIAPLEAVPSLCRQSTDVPYYFVSRGAQYSTLDPHNLQELMKFSKPLDAEFVGVYQLKNVRDMCPK